MYPFAPPSLQSHTIGRLHIGYVQLLVADIHAAPSQLDGSAHLVPHFLAVVRLGVCQFFKSLYLLRKAERR